ncbi:MAG: hypothetical protein IJ849_09235 [Selenomonadaceae bacterium]|nr:hypothetical protein [Selenomonadaceae bacterium]
MAEKVWRTCRLTINGMVSKVLFNEDTIDNLFFPFLRRLTRLHDRLGHRLLVYLVAPPGTGKTTLSLLLAKLSLMGEEFEPVQAVGIEGFYKALPPTTMKGAPETFDSVKLGAKLRAIREDNPLWPLYDARRQRVMEDALTLRKNIILLEGNWLLLRDNPWQDIKDYADHTLFITAKPEQLWERLVQRRISGGYTPEAAAKIYEIYDRPNIDRVLNDSWLASETWKMLNDGDYVLKSNAPRPITMVDRESLWKKTKVVADDDDFLSNLHYKLSRLNVGDHRAFSAGFTEGLVAARDEILRRIHSSGSMDREKLMATFKLSPEELTAILGEKE